MPGKRRLGRTDIEVTPIGLGCAQMAQTGMTSRVYPTREAGAVVQAAPCAPDCSPDDSTTTPRPCVRPIHSAGPCSAGPATWNAPAR